MSTLGQIRDALGALALSVDDRLTGLPRAITNPNLPAIVVLPGPADFMIAMARGAETYSFRVQVIVSLRDYDLAQREMDEYVSAEGDKSIREAIWNANAGGDGRPGMILADTQARCTGMQNYGGQLEAIGTDHFAAELLVETITSRGAS